MMPSNAVPLPLPNENAALNFLTSQGWPKGLQRQFIIGATHVPVRFIIVDNSGSMMTNDGQRLVSLGDQGSKSRFLQCSRWTELTESLRFHAALAEAANIPTEFRLLNNSNPLMLGVGDDNGQRLHQLLHHFDQSPSGGTPLCRHISEIVSQITALAPQLRANGQKAGLIIATDGESSDGDIAQAMSPLRGLPVWVVIRLCTGEDKIVDYWNNIDSQLEVDMDVLDDFESEAREIAKVNDWFTYGEPLHRLREFGIVMKDLDLIDEATLATDQMRNIVAMLLTNSPGTEIPHPGMDWRAFIKFITPLNNTLPKFWCPIRKSMQHRVHVHALTKRYRKGGMGCCLM